MAAMSDRATWLVAALNTCFAFCLVQDSVAQERAAGKTQSVNSATDATIAESQPAPNDDLARLEVLIGPWRIKETHFNPRGEIIASVEGTEEVTWLLDKHALQRVYQTYAGASVYRALGLLTCKAPEKHYEGVWLDNASVNGPVRLSGRWSPESRGFIFEVEVTDKDGAIRKYRRIEELIDEQNRLATTYLVEGGTVTKVLEVRYERTIHCPDKVRPVATELLKKGG